jgi:predicted nucleic acid-binding protein
MNTWLIDTALLKMLATPQATILRQWLHANNPELFLSAVSLTEIAAAINKTAARQPERAHALRVWLEGIISHFGDRIHSVDSEVSMRAGALIPRVASGLPRFRLHDAVLLATARTYGHGLLTRREGVFGSWTETPIAVI